MGVDHNWGPHRYKGKLSDWGHNWCTCIYCGASRQYDYMPGWPGYYTYFTKEGGYGPREGRDAPPCCGSPQLELNL